LLGEDGATQYTKLTLDGFSAEYDIVIGEAQETPTQKQELAELSINFANTAAPYMPQAASALFTMAAKSLKNLGFNPKDIQPVVEAMEAGAPQQPDPAAAQAQQAMMQAQLATMQAQIENMNASAVYKMAQAEKLKIDGIKTQADTAQTAANIQQTELETALALKQSPNVNITL